MLALEHAESENILSIAYELFKSILPENVFYKKGMNGPDIFITDDSSSERLSLRQSFPNSKLILCIFHVLQATWRYIWDAKTAVHKDDRVPIFSFVKSLLYSKTVDELSENTVVRLQTPLYRNIDASMHISKNYITDMKSGPFAFEIHFL